MRVVTQFWYESEPCKNQIVKIFGGAIPVLFEGETIDIDGVRYLVERRSHVLDGDTIVGASFITDYQLR